MKKITAKKWISVIVFMSAMGVSRIIVSNALQRNSPTSDAKMYWFDFANGTCVNEPAKKVLKRAESFQIENTNCHTESQWAKLKIIVCHNEDRYKNLQLFAYSEVENDCMEYVKSFREIERLTPKPK